MRITLNMQYMLGVVVGIVICKVPGIFTQLGIAMGLGILVGMLEAYGISDIVFRIGRKR